MIRILVLAEIRFYREGLARILDQRAELQVVGTSDTVPDAISLAQRVPIDVALFDVSTAGCVEGIRAFTKRFPQATIVALGVRENERDVIAPAEAGALGYVSRDASLEDLCRAIEIAAIGETPCSPRIAALLVRQVSLVARETVPEQSKLPLTRRELEIACLIDEGLANKAIARELSIDVSTVKNHVHNILRKLGVKRREEVAIALQRFPHESPIGNGKVSDRSATGILPAGHARSLGSNRR